jgi:hypothetical protein
VCRTASMALGTTTTSLRHRETYPLFDSACLLLDARFYCTVVKPDFSDWKVIDAPVSPVSSVFVCTLREASGYARASAVSTAHGRIS